MYDFAATFDSFEEFATEESSTSVRSRSVLKFRQRDAADAGENASARETGSELEFEPRDPVAHPSYKTRAEGAAHPVYQFCEEPPAAKAAERAELPISKQTEVDIATFLEAVASAFPRPRDPLMPRVLRARPKKAARPFLYVAEEAMVPEVSEPEAAGEAGDELKETEAVVGRPSLEKVPPAESKAAAEVPYDPILEGAGFKIAWGKPVEVNPVRPVEPHERELIDAVIEPLEPMAKPRFPLQTEVAGAAQPRLSPSQRAHLKQPTVVRDCNGRLTAVTYSLNPQGKGQERSEA